MYKVFFNDRIVFVEPGFKKSLIPGWLEGQIETAADVAKWWQYFLNDSERRNLFLSGPDNVWTLFNNYFHVLEAAGGLVFNANHALLCIERFGKWDLPKGKIETGEDPEQAALREVEEETGLYGVQLKTFCTKTFHIYPHPKKPGVWILKPTHWYTMYYGGNGLPVPQIEEGIKQVQWVLPANIDMILGNTYASLVDLFRLNS